VAFPGHSATGTADDWRGSLAVVGASKITQEQFADRRATAISLGTAVGALSTAWVAVGAPGWFKAVGPGLTAVCYLVAFVFHLGERRAKRARVPPADQSLLSAPNVELPQDASVDGPRPRQHADGGWLSWQREAVETVGLTVSAAGLLVAAGYLAMDAVLRAAG
jgi:hypothetical protein